MSCVVLFSAAGLTKLRPREGSQLGVLDVTWLRILVGLTEFGVAGSLCIVKWRPAGLLIGSVLTVGMIAYVLVAIARSSPSSCGCFGGWIELQRWAELGLLGLMAAMLAQLRGVHS